MRLLRLSPALLLLGAGLPEPCAQSQVPTQARAMAAAQDELIPIHTQPRGECNGAEYGYWAAGRGYKCSFHDGFAFYPFVGPKMENVPLRWRTTSVRAGGSELLLAGETPAHAYTSQRYEYRHASFVEAYDVLAHGVEQTFTIVRRPDQPGPITVRGRVITELTSESFHEQHRKVTFADAGGQERVVYGEAHALDARGRKVPVLSSFDGEQIELQVAASFVQAAEFPLVIDPLTSPVVVDVFGGATWGMPLESAIGRESESNSRNVMIAFAREFSASDRDCYVLLCNDDFSGSTVWTHINAAYDTRKPSVAAVGGANRWIVVMELWNSTRSQCEAITYVHDFQNTVFASGYSGMRVNSGVYSMRPKVGGQRSFTAGAYALVVFEYNNGSSYSEVFGRLVDLGSPTSTPPRPPAVVGPNVYLGGGPAGPSIQRLHPCINQESGGGDSSWIVGWTEKDYSLPGSKYDFRIARCSPTQLTASVTIGFATYVTNEVQPRIAGRDGRYLGSFLASASGGSTGEVLYAQRFDWPETAASPAMIGDLRPVVANTSSLSNGDLAYDTFSASHWAATWTQGTNVATSDVYAARLGYTGGVVELVTVYAQQSAGAFSPSITFDTNARHFVLSYCSYDLGVPLLPVYAQRLTYQPNAGSVAYGTGCGGAIWATNSDAGNEFFKVTLAAGSINANRNAALMLGAVQTSVDLTPSGMPSCFLNVNPMVLVNTVTNASGDAGLPFPLPDAPAIIGTLYFQWLYETPFAPWSLKLTTTQGLRTSIR